LPSDAYSQTLDKIYDDQRKVFSDRSIETSGRYDKALLTITSGAIGVSLLFIEKIAPHPNPATIWELKLAWIGLCLSLVLQLLSTYLSPMACRQAIKLLDKEHKVALSCKEDLIAFRVLMAKAENEYNKYVCRVSLFAFLTFIFGFAMLIWFAIANL
jgi:hypothetical protein